MGFSKFLPEPRPAINVLTVLRGVLFFLEPISPEMTVWDNFLGVSEPSEVIDNSKQGKPS